MQVREFMSTHFAPAERASREELEHQVATLAASPITQQLLENVPKAVLILNRHRQIVAANAASRDLLGHGRPEVIGLRPGEAVGCTHADREDGGCGTSEACALCNATQAIIASLQGRPDSRACRIPRVNGHAPLDLKVSVTPVEVDAQFFIVLIASPARGAGRELVRRTG